ncbi:hypothetical protein [Methanoregula sp.]|mgnify:CR=1 FL=1|jgi:hypothetical protein|uniref:hypothetical protein n=1 Tax=Methanoregula sp. TaxID=2052170 RepID=UPI00262AA62B|nr:hypothetical protein [Methanoregula sp.]MDD5142562.1 hypothetical protein [Methanoregula sp.]
MKYHVLAACVLIISGVMIAGCSQGTTASSAPTGTPGTVVTSTATPHVSFSLGSHYLQDPQGYTFLSEKDVIVREFRIDDPSWGIDFVVLPLNDDPQYCWFEMTVTNMDNGQAETYGFGRTFSYEKHQQFPMYVTGSYKIEMKGNLVKVDVTAAKRNP